MSQVSATSIAAFRAVGVLMVFILFNRSGFSSTFAHSQLKKDVVIGVLIGSLSA